MKSTLLAIAAAVGLVSGGTPAQENKSLEPGAKPAEGSSGLKPQPSREELEAKFKATLTKAVMTGRWCSIKDGALGPQKEDKYTITSVAKVKGDTWVIYARIQYNAVDVVAPIPVQVKWAGDTPVLIVDKIPIPGSGVYSARVLIYDHTYAGTWSGGDHGGLLSGIIINEGTGKVSDSK